MIRACILSDINELTQIAYQTFDETFREQNKKENIDQYLANTFTEDRVLKELENPNSFFYFIYHNESLAGYLKLNIKGAQTERFGDNKLEIERIYILNQFQKLGLGKELYDKSLEKAQELLCEDIWLGVWEKNHNAIEFYKKLGFKKIDEHAFYMGDEKQIDYIMIKQM
ncbi:GNAT family N-acetyltransferase [Mammaliicoccus sp. Dog046]|uniref:GNAT family N-acetyltransferase n=1 Tax=Mammaliicoccus sp. Dog046 TaxID=3034233 RepID=UPI002B2596CA|nr:GNAT family N-acetyltransferase [Mammaliicoccus sp. Dog046]WQK86336.1 GNAT family N-acetyltransferase [Mammaliicoccus sp. Dog046]